MSGSSLLILGCGWVGTELATRQIRQGVTVWATTTDEIKRAQLRAKGIEAVTHDFDEPTSLAIPRMQSFKTIVVSVPATRKYSHQAIKKRFEHIRNSLTRYNYDKVIFLSSVGVYPDETGVYDEGYHEPHRMDPNLREAETCIQGLSNVSVFRLGGLFGKDRIFAKYFQNRVCETGDQKSNFVHLDDVVGVVERFILVDPVINGVYNVVAPEHPTKKEVILASAEKHGFEKPSNFRSTRSFEKIVSSEKIIKLLNYTFKYPSPLEF